MDKDELLRKIKDSKKPTVKKEGKGAGRKRLILDLILILPSVLLIIFIIVVNFRSYQVRSYQVRCGSFCSCAEQDAKNVLASIASYFSEPENMRMPEVSVLVSDEGLSLNNPSANVSLYPRPGNLVQDFSLSSPGAFVHSIRVRIFDASGRCPRNNAYIATMAGGIGYWE